MGLEIEVNSYTGYIINGYKFQTRDREKDNKFQNSEVVVKDEASRYTSARDSNPIIGNMDYFGVLTEVLELKYYRGKRVTLFKCDWRDVYTGRRMKVDEYGIISMNSIRSLRTNDPFILAS